MRIESSEPNPVISRVESAFTSARECRGLGRALEDEVRVRVCRVECSLLLCVCGVLGVRDCKKVPSCELST